MSNKQTAGFTVLELLIAISVSSILVIGLLTIVINRFIEIRRIDTRSNMQIDARDSLQIMSNDLKESSGVDATERWTDIYEPTNPNNWVSDTDTLILTSPAYDNNNNPLFEDPNLYITHKNNHIYFVDNNTLYQRTLADPVANNAAKTTCPEISSSDSCPADKKLAENVVEIAFEYNDSQGNAVTDEDTARSVKIDITFSKNIFNSDETITRSIESVMRNR